MRVAPQSQLRDISERLGTSSGRESTTQRVTAERMSDLDVQEIRRMHRLAGRDPLCDPLGGPDP